MGELFNYFDVEPVHGKDITIGDNFLELYISNSDEVFCYAGICLNDINDRRRTFFMHPYYMVGKHSILVIKYLKKYGYEYKKVFNFFLKTWRNLS